MERSSINARALSVLALALVPLAACGGGGGGGGGGNPNQPPSSLVYSRVFAQYGKGVLIADNLPTVRGGAVSTWSIAPALPPGLTFDAANGEITGTPTALSTNQSYVVTASNAFGSVDTTLEIGVVRPPLMVVAANSADDTLSTFVVDASTGLLRPTGYSLPTGASHYPRGIATDHSGQFVYVANRLSGDLSIFDLEPSSGRLTARTSLATASAAPNEIVMHPSADVMYVIGRMGTHVQAFGIDAGTGDLTSIGSLAIANGIETAITDSQGRWLWVANVNNDTITTVALSNTTFLPSATGLVASTSNKPISLVLSRDERFLYSLALDGSRVQTFAVDMNTGGLTLLQTLLTGLLPARLAIDPSGRFLYCAISSDDTIRTYSVDTNTGLLTQLAITPSGDRPGTVVVDPTGSFLYTTEIDSNEVGVFSIDPATGALLRQESMRARLQPIYLQVVAGDDPAAPKAKYAYVSNSGSGDVSMFSSDPNTGALTTLTGALPIGGQPQSVSCHPNGRWVYSVDTANDQVFANEVDSLTGALNSLGAPVAVGDAPIASAVDPSGRFLYVVNQGSGDLRVLDIDPVAGTLIATSIALTSSQPTGLALDPSGRFVLVSDATANNVQVFQISKLDGAVTPTSVPAPLTGEPTALAFHPTGRYVFASFFGTGRVGLFSVDSTDGTLTQITTKPSGVEPCSFGVDPYGRYVYVTNRNNGANGDVTIFKLDTSSQVLTRVDEADAGNAPVAAVVDPSGRYLYVANEGSGDVTRLVINRKNGRLFYPLAAPAGVGPSAIALVGTIE